MSGRERDWEARLRTSGTRSLRHRYACTERRESPAEAPGYAWATTGASRDGIEPPVTRHALQFAGATILELDPRAGDEVFHRRRDEHFARLGQRGDARSRGHCDPAQLAVDPLALARVQARADLETECADGIADRGRAFDRTPGPVERGEETV